MEKEEEEEPTVAGRAHSHPRLLPWEKELLGESSIFCAQSCERDFWSGVGKNTFSFPKSTVYTRQNSAGTKEEFSARSSVSRAQTTYG